MADLFDRQFPAEGVEVTEVPRINPHVLTAALVLYSESVFTSPQIISHFNMDTSAESDWNALVVNLDSTSGVANKVRVLLRLESAGVAVSEKVITTKAAYKLAAGIT